MVGVASTWNSDAWLSDIKLAASGGFDGFALNAAGESLTVDVSASIYARHTRADKSDIFVPLQSATQLATAYAAAKSFGTTFKLFISFDMVRTFPLVCLTLSHSRLSQTVFPCTAAKDADVLVALSKLYYAHPNQAMYKSTGQPIFSSFGGSDCTFGTSGTWSAAWESVVLTPLVTASAKTPFFVPAMYEESRAPTFEFNLPYSS